MITWGTRLVVSYVGVAPGRWRWSVLEGQVGRTSGARAVSQAGDLPAVLGTSAPAALRCPFHWEQALPAGDSVLFLGWRSEKCSWIPEHYGIQLARGCAWLNSMTQVMPSAPVSLHVPQLLWSFFKGQRDSCCFIWIEVYPGFLQPNLSLSWVHLSEKVFCKN